jgi:hypothetical protein
MQSTLRQKPLSKVDEQLLEKTKAQVIKQVERQRMIGTDL